MQFKTNAGKLRQYLHRNISKINTTDFFLLILLIIITFYPLFFVGFTTEDDIDIAINYGLTSNLYDTAKYHAAAQGRFTFLWNYPFLQVPYIIDSRLWYLTMKFGAFFLLLAALYYAVNRIFRSSWIALTSLLLYLAFIQNGWDHNALTSYAFAFNLYAVLLLVSLGLFSEAIDKNKFILAVISAVLYFFALGIELFVLFFPFYIAVIISRSSPNVTAIRQLILGKKYISMIAIALIVYLAIYMVWRINYPSNYDGNSLNAFNLLAAGKVVGAYSLSAFPFASLSFLLYPELQMPFTDAVGLSGILSELNATVFIKPAVAGFLFARLMTTDHFVLPHRRTIVYGAMLAFIGIFLPNLLLGFVQKHQDLVHGYSYVYTYYSFIAAVVFAALAVAYMNVKFRAWHPKVRLMLILICTALTIAVCFTVEVRNQFISLDQKLSHRKWQLMDVVIKSSAFMKIPDGSTVIAPSLLMHFRGAAVASPDYWSKYAKNKLGKNVQFVKDKCENKISCYSLVFRQELHSDNQFIVLAKIRNPDFLVSSELTIYSMPNQVNTVLMGSFLPGERTPKLEINGTFINIGTGFFSSALPFVSDAESVQIAKLTGNADIFPDQITISHYGIVPRLQSVTVESGNGFYGWETGADQPAWAWSRGNSELVVTNYNREAMAVSVEFEVTSLETMNLHIKDLPKKTFPVAPVFTRLFK